MFFFDCKSKKMAVFCMPAGMQKENRAVSTAGSQWVCKGLALCRGARGAEPLANRRFWGLFWRR